jgi:ribonuclease HII
MSPTDKLQKRQRVESKAAKQTEEARLEGMLVYEKALWAQSLSHVAGVDEAGMAPLAGPVVAAAVVLPHSFRLHGVKDSKKIGSQPKREKLAAQIRELCLAWAVAEASVEEIDRLNIYQAGRLAMQRAVLALSVVPQHCLVDARQLDKLPCPQTALIRGDNLSLSIAAASPCSEPAGKLLPRPSSPIVAPSFSSSTSAFALFALTPALMPT